MELILNFSDGSIAILPDPSYEIFEKYIFKLGASDIEYKKYLDENCMTDINDFYAEDIEKATLTIKDRLSGRTIGFECVYVSDKY